MVTGVNSMYIVLLPRRAMDQRNQNAVQNWMLASERLAGVSRLITAKHPGVGVYCRARGLANKCRWGNLDFGVVANPFYFP